MKFHVTLEADAAGNPNLWAGVITLDVEVTGNSFVGGPEPAEVVEANAEQFNAALRNYFDEVLANPGGWYKQVLTAERLDTLFEITPGA